MIQSPSDCLLLQSDLSRLSNCSSHWKLSFNELKCTLIHFSPNSPEFIENFTPNQQQLSVSNSCKDLGVILTSNLDFSDHYTYISGQAYKILGLLRRTLSNCTSTHAKKLLYITLVHSKLTYCSCIWRPHLLKDIITLENIQRRTTKFILNDFTSDYKSRLVKLNLFPLMLLFELYDLTFFFKCLKFPSSAFDVTKFVTFSSSSTRSSTNHKLIHSKSSTNLSRHFYFNRLPRLWNSLPVFSLDQSLSSFKLLLKNVLWSYFLNNLDPDKPCSFHYVEPVHTLHLLISLLRLLVNSSSPTETLFYFPVPYVLYFIV